jgi:hypothetical protein
MKHILTLIIALSFTLTNAYGQFSKEEKEILEIVKSQDSIPRSVFLDSTLLANMKVKVTNTRQIWFSKSKTEKHIDQLFDIRLKFANHDSALAFHKKYLGANSEYGPEIKKHKIKYKGADEFEAFNGADMVNKMVEPYGLQMYCYLFVVDNYFVKIYVTCNKDYKPEKFQDLVTDIINRIKK